jgi:nucleoid-associated protein YgaU
MRMRSVRSLLAGAVALLLTGSAHMGATLAATSAEERVRAQAEAMADAASKEFNAFMERQNLAQANPQKPAGVTVKTEEREPGLLGWFRQSGFSFQNLMRKLAGEQATPPAWDPVADARTRMPAEQQPTQTASAATAKPPAEAPKAAEAKPAVSDKREPDARTAKPPQKTDPAKPAEAKPADTKPKADAARPDVKQTAKPAETTPTKGVDTAKAPAKDAASPKPPVVADAKPAVSPKPSEVKAPAAAPAPAPPAKAETPKAPAVAKAPVPAGKTAMVTAPPATPDAKPQAGKSKPRARASLPPVAACRGAGTLSNGWYTVRQGDSLWRIAERHLGSGTRYRVVQAANRRGIADAGLIRACQRIYIPGHGGRRRG